ncbi:hypothetical protein AJ80_05468 [Polytolypa hystricis UAMH7299]|uniref:Uncharacterized protein n=1 Tax=Polytolypa hystricis (strain UAMH7299) TaxID=1447883 RepID=A0A2B7XV06_POLH7|nr:hypothetical protein AJ80_05468 [Polytolypa hystricis UAMH7299]
MSFSSLSKWYTHSRLFTPCESIAPSNSINPTAPDLRLQKVQKMLPQRRPGIRRLGLPHAWAPAIKNSDEYCPHCDNHFVIEAKTPKPSLKIESEDVRIDSRMLKDDRLRGEEQRSIFNVKDAPDRLG